VAQDPFFQQIKHFPHKFKRFGHELLSGCLSFPFQFGELPFHVFAVRAGLLRVIQKVSDPWTIRIVKTPGGKVSVNLEQRFLSPLGQPHFFARQRATPGVVSCCVHFTLSENRNYTQARRE
jgi:hypothetical protein